MKTLVAITVFVAVAALAVIWTVTGSSGPPDSVGDASEDRHDGLSNAGAPAPGGGIVAVGGRDVLATDEHPSSRRDELERTSHPDEYVCTHCETSLLNALDEEEAHWLLTHGYPTYAAKELMSELPLDELYSLASDHGGLSAKAVYAGRLATEGASDGLRAAGVNQLRQLVARGSVYALIELSEALAAHPHLLEISPFEREASLQAAALLGDQVALDHLRSEFPRSYSDNQERIHDRALALIEAANEQRAIRDLEPLAATMRPNAGASLTLSRTSRRPGDE